MKIDMPELSANESQALRGIEGQLRRHLDGIGPSERFDERVLARIREWDAQQLVAKRAQAQEQYVRWTEALARQWRNARHVLIARLAAFATVAIVTAVALRNALPQELEELVQDYFGGSTFPLPWSLTIVAAGTIAIGWGISARVKL